MEHEIKPDRAAWLRGPVACCDVLPGALKRPWRLVLLGAPGVGKGTQAQLLCRRLGTCHLSTGDVFRGAKTLSDCERTPLMTAALDFMRKGELVPDETVLGVVRERVQCLSCGGGFLLDGFPRTVAQAQALAQLMKERSIVLDAVLDYQLPLDEIVARLSGRRTCTACRAVFHVTDRPPKVADVCDQCRGQLIQRDDDRPESIRVRMQAYAMSTVPLTDFYRAMGLLISVPADGSPEEVFARSIRLLENAGRITDRTVARP